MKILILLTCLIVITTIYYNELNHKSNLYELENIDIPEEEIYAGRNDISNGIYDSNGLPINRKWLTSKEWQGKHIKSKATKTNFNKWKKSYIKQFVKDMSKIALVESKAQQYKIPPSLIVAQIILESNYGKSRLAVTANNYFGHKYYGKGTINKDYIIASDDSPNDKFKIYESRWFSIRSHSKLLLNKYAKRIRKNYYINSWYYALCGGITADDSKKFVDNDNYVYATSCYKKSPCYAEKIENIINTYKLYKLDEQIKKAKN